jgi:hypothetical protein
MWMAAEGGDPGFDTTSPSFASLEIDCPGSFIFFITSRGRIYLVFDASATGSVLLKVYDCYIVRLRRNIG